MKYARVADRGIRTGDQRAKGDFSCENQLFDKQRAETVRFVLASLSKRGNQVEVGAEAGVTYVVP
jgi:hypothetical protein